MPESWTIRSVLDWTSDAFAKRDIESARLDAEILVAAALETERVQLYLDPGRPLTAVERQTIRQLVGRRLKREPVAYILGYRDFFRRRFKVDANVLIPRPETEALVERALEIISGNRVKKVLELCTGSGAVVVSLAAEHSEVNFYATDISEAALEVAKHNAIEQGAAQNIEWLCSDMFAELGAEKNFDLILANPPYIAHKELQNLEPEVTSFEPALALDGGRDGLDYYRRLAQEAAAYLRQGARLLFEIGQGQEQEIEVIFKNANHWELREARRDLAGQIRIMEYEQMQA